LIIHSNKTKTKHGIIKVSLLIPHQMLLYYQLLQNSIIDTRDRSLVRL
jgi:hypothetical protein